MPQPGAPPSPFGFDLKLWPTHEEEESIRSMLAGIYGDRYDATEANALLDLAAKCFEEADAQIEWPDGELFKLLCEAQDRVDWLIQLVGGETPNGWKPPPAVIRPDHIRNPQRRKALGLDDADRVAPRANPRLESTLAHAAARNDQGSLSLSQAQSGLMILSSILQASADEIEPARAPITDHEIRLGLERRIERATAWAKLRRQRKLTVAEEVKARMDALPEEFMERPFRQGRRPASTPLVTLVEGLSRSWQRVFAAPPPLVRAPAVTSASEAFSGILRAFEAAYRRQDGELGRAVVDPAVNRLRSRR